MQKLSGAPSGPRLSDTSFTFSHRVRRAAWMITWKTLASWTPPQMHKWRNLLLRLFGAKIHPSARIYSSARIWYPPNLSMAENSVIGPEVKCYCQARVTIARGAIISQGAHLCAGTHDISDINFTLVTKPIAIGPHAWIAAEAFVGPGATIGEGSVLGARAVLFRDAEPWGVYAGNPATLIKTRHLRTQP